MAPFATVEEPGPWLASSARPRRSRLRSSPPPTLPARRVAPRPRRPGDRGRRPSSSRPRLGHGVGHEPVRRVRLRERGWAYDRILAHYYPRHDARAAPVSAYACSSPRRGRGRRLPTVTFTVRTPPARRSRCPRRLRVGPGLIVQRGGAADPLLFRPGGRARSARRQALPRRARDLRRDGKLLAVVNPLGLERLPPGRRPRRCRSVWPAEALKAQAVAARSYALARRTGKSFDVYADVRSQVYGGSPAEEPESSEAVVGDSGRDAPLRGQGGDRPSSFRPAAAAPRAAADVVGQAGALPRPVAGPVRLASPYHSWGPVAFRRRRRQGRSQHPG